MTQYHKRPEVNGFAAGECDLLKLRCLYCGVGVIKVENIDINGD